MPGPVLFVRHTCCGTGWAAEPVEARMRETRDPMATVRTMFAAFDARDFDALTETVHPESRWRYYGANPRLSQAEFHGRCLLAVPNSRGTISSTVSKTSAGRRARKASGRVKPQLTAPKAIPAARAAL